MTHNINIHNLGEGLTWQKIKWACSSFWAYFLESLPIITASANWGAIFDLEIPS